MFSFQCSVFSVQFSVFSFQWGESREGMRRGGDGEAGTRRSLAKRKREKLIGPSPAARDRVDSSNFREN